MVADTVREPRLGIGTMTDSSGVRVTQLVPGGAASMAGVRAGDVIRSIGAVPVHDDASFEAFRARYAGTTLGTLPLEITRGGQTLTIQLPVRLAARGQVRVMLRADATAKARAVWHGIITGRTGG
jgi:S1-C subfamily serine protease